MTGSAIDHPLVSVVIAAADAAAIISGCLAAISEQDYRGPIEVIVAAADEGTANAATREGARVIDNPGRTAPAGLNRAIGEAKGEIIVRVDAQSMVPTHYLSTVVQALERTHASNVGGRQIPSGSGLVQSSIAAAMSSRFGAGDARYRIGGVEGPVDTVYLGAFRRETLDEVGGYDEGFTRHQDYELNHRIRLGGGKVWLLPDLEVQYRPRSSFKELASQYFQYGRWKRRFARKYSGSLLWRHWAPPALVVGLTFTVLSAFVFPWLLLFPTSYGVALLVVSVPTIARQGTAAALMPIALSVMHVAWGVGFLSPQTKEA